MESTLITGMAAVLGSVAGASASIATTWMTQHSQKIREQAQAEFRRRETLYSEFITEVSRLTADAFEHSLECHEILVNAYAIAGRIHRVASAPVMNAADQCCSYIVDLYSSPNKTVEQTRTALQVLDHPLRAFETTCRAELEQCVVQ